MKMKTLIYKPWAFPLLTFFLVFGEKCSAQINFWGLSSSNSNDYGVIFRTDSVGRNYSDVFTFSDSLLGIKPFGSLIQATDGLLYGMTSEGGINNLGCIFSFNPQNLSYQKLYDFDGLNGAKPLGSLIEFQGKLFGLSFEGGTINRGVVFAFEPNTGQFSKLADFEMGNGANPYGSMLVFQNKFYGLTSLGGVDGTGCIFEFDPQNNELHRKHSFIIGPSGNGYDPRGSLLKSSSGLLYGFSRFGQLGFQNGGGVLFKYDLNASVLNQFTPLHQFSDTAAHGVGGWELFGSPTEGLNGKIYGMTVKGGLDSAGSIFEYDPITDSLQKIYDFQKSSDGFYPQGSFIQASNGKLYAWTSSPGGQAKLFEFDIQSRNMILKSNITGTPYFGNLLETTSAIISNSEHLQNRPLKLFPNPSRDFLKIQNCPENSKFQIYNSRAMLLKSGEIDEGLIYISDLDSGIYIIKISNGQISYQRKFEKL